MKRDQALSTLAVLAIACAVAVFLVGPVGGFFLAMAAVVLGVFAVVRSVSPRKRGALFGFVAIAVGLIGMVAKILQGALALLF